MEKINHFLSSTFIEASPFLSSTLLPSLILSIRSGIRSRVEKIPNSPTAANTELSITPVGGRMNETIIIIIDITKHTKVINPPVSFCNQLRNLLIMS